MKHSPQHLAALLLAAASTAPAWAQAPAVFPTDTENIALATNGGRVIAVTSTIDNDPNFNANNLIDGQVITKSKPKASAGWASNRFDPIDMESVTIGFRGDTVRRIGKIVLNPTANVAPERWAKDVEVQVTTDDPTKESWRTVLFASVRRAAEAQEFKFVPADAKYVRLVFRTSWGSDRAVALGEVEVYEAIGQGDPIGQIIAQFEGAVGELKKFRQSQFDAPLAATTLAQAPALSDATLQLVQSTGGAAATRAQIGSMNIAAQKNGGRVVDFSSQFVSDPAQGADPEYAPSKLLDGSVVKQDGTGSAGWASQGFVPGKQFVTIGFAEDRTRLISKVVLNPASAQSDLRWARRVDVQVTSESAKDGPYRNVRTLNLRPEAINQEFTIGPVEAKYVRLVFLANGPGVTLPGADPDVNSDRAVSLGEVEIYEAAASGQALDELISRFEQVLLELKNVRKNPRAVAVAAAAR